MKNIPINIVVSTTTFLLSALLLTFWLRIAYMGFGFKNIIILGIAVLCAVVGILCVRNILKEKKANPEEKFSKAAKVTIAIMIIPTAIVMFAIVAFIFILIDPLNQFVFM